MSKKIYQSETSKHRTRLAPYCAGYGIDIGFGGDPITPNAIRVDLEVPYAHTGENGVQLGGDCRNLYWFADGVLDFVYSSHVLEDFDVHQTIPVMQEWSRILKAGGRLILLQPDQQRYLAYCQKNGQPPNAHHSIDHFSLPYLIEAAKKMGTLELLASEDNIDEYSFFVVFVKKVESQSDAGSAQAQAEVKRLRMELARVESQLQKSQHSLERYRNHPIIQLLKKPYRFFKRFSSRN